MKKIEKLQTLLPLGYLYLVVLGMVKETLSFYPLGINILKYATIMDILISPIADIFSHYVILLAILIITLFAMLLPKLMVKHHKAQWVNIYLGRNPKKETPLTLEEVISKSSWFPLRFLAVMFLCFFVGFGWASGNRTKESLQAGSLKYKHSLYFGDGAAVPIHLVDVNNAYYFYVEKGSKEVKISPIGAVKALVVNQNRTNSLAQ